MRSSWLLLLSFFILLPLYEAETVVIKQVVKAGRSKFKCLFTITYKRDKVDLKKSKASCLPRKPKTKAKNIKLSAPSGIQFLVDMTFNPTRIVKAVVVYPDTTTKKQTTTKKTTTTTTTPTTSSGQTPVKMSNCGPKECGVWCNDGETCHESENVNCVQEPCCPRWKCKGSILPPTPPPIAPPTPPPIAPPTPTPSPPTPSTCCKEKQFKESVYVLVGEEETLPSCGNECIYREENNEANTQIYCFPTSFSKLENQCDSINTAPQLLVGFSPWGEWTGCQGECGMVGRSSRERSCVSDIMDELSCMGPTKQVQNCELPCINIAKQSQNCDSKMFPRNVMALDYLCKYHFLPAKDWNEAQDVCNNEFGGKLWEPANAAEYAAVVNAAESQANYNFGSCRWWLGLFNWNDGSPNSVDAYLSSTVIAPTTTPPNHDEPIPRNGVISNFITVTDGNDGGNQNCVHTDSNWDSWRDTSCTRELPFICQACTPPCSCNFNGVSYPCGSIIKRNPHCCSDLTCNSQGTIVEDQMLGANGKPEAGCCIWRGKIYKDGANFGPKWFRKVCCRGEVLSKRFWWLTFPLPYKPIGSVLTISEGGETIIQENIFSNVTGILEISVPPHKNYTDSVFILHQDSKTSMLKTNNTCQISDLPRYINVSAMAKQLETLESENNTVTEAKTVTTFVLKARLSRYGIRKREELLPQIQDQCQNEPVIQTNDFIVNQTEFEKYKAGEVILVGNGKQTRTCETVLACSNEGPRACGYGWTNPDPDAPVKGFTFHQVSDGSICVNCTIEYTGGPKCPGNGFCRCKDIKNKEDLEDCVLYNTTQSHIEEDGEIFTQTLEYNRKADARSIAITSPAHKDLQSLEVVMHAHSNGYWHHYAKNNYMMKLGNECHISTLPTDVFPIDIAIGIQEIKKGNNVTIKVDEVETQGIIIGDGSLTTTEQNALHSDIKSRCSNSKVQKFKEKPVNKSQSMDLKNGKIIFIAPKSTRSQCLLETAVTSNNNSTSCWRWPNPGTGVEIWVHHVVSSVIALTCCTNLEPFPTCCEDNYPEYCECSTITNEQIFDTCMPPLITEISSEDLAANGTKIKVSQVFNYDRDDGGSMRIEVEAHKDYEKSSLIFNDTMMVLKRGNKPCTVFSGLPGASSPMQVALNADETTKTNGENVPLEDQTRQDYILVGSDEIPNVEGKLDVCHNYTYASVMSISSEQFETLNSANVIFLDGPSMAGGLTRASNKCDLKDACATNNGSSCFRFPTPAGNTIYVHDVVSSPTCLQCCNRTYYTDSHDPNYCDCSDITDSKSFEFCLGPRPEALFIATGVDTNSDNVGSVEILTRDKLGNYVSKTQAGCYVDNFPVQTSSATGAFFNDLVHVCVGYKEGEPSSQCYGLTSNGSWDKAFNLENSLSSWGSSATFSLLGEVKKLWWIVGGEPDGLSTEVWGEDPPVQISWGSHLKLPTIINQPCMAKIDDQEVFISAIPKFESASSNFAWTYAEHKGWTRLPNTIEKRSGPSCGFLQSSTGRYIVLAGGYKSSTTEILNLDTNKWTTGPDIGTKLYGGSMVSVKGGHELLLIGGYSTEALSHILKMNSSMASWEQAGSLIKARFNAVAIGVPLGNLPPKFDWPC